MYISEAIETADKLKPNAYTREDKVKWLSDIDKQIFLEIIITHSPSEESENIRIDSFTGYGPETDIENTKLLAPSPFDDLYIHGLKRQIDLHNDEYSKYNNDCLLFNSAYTNFYDWYNRGHEPKGEPAFKI